MDARNCPKCGKRSLAHGYGLMGGGFGAHTACTSKGCTFFFKEQECPVCEGKLDAEGACANCGAPEDIRRRLDEIYPKRCGACMKPQNYVDGLCANMCSDGPCGDPIRVAKAAS